MDRARDGITFWACGSTMGLSGTSETGPVQLSFVHGSGLYSLCLLVSCTSIDIIYSSMCKGNRSQLIFQLQFHLHVFPRGFSLGFVHNDGRPIHSEVHIRASFQPVAFESVSHVCNQTQW